MKLPEMFLHDMQEILGQEEYAEFVESYQKKRTYGLRWNPLKQSREQFLLTMPYQLKEVSWSEEGFFYQEAEQPGKSALHEAGAYYIQEPSAMIAVEILSPLPGEKICDLCAAPGGKSTQIAGRMQGKGLLVSNEIHSSRSRILSQNMERTGVRNSVVMNESPEKLAARFPLFFDRVLVDAPCSGEGMFRKDPEAIGQWSEEAVEMCAARQNDILECAASMVRPGGVLVYTTCTFSRQENEEAVRKFLQNHEEFSADGTVMREKWKQDGICEGGLPGTIRMWPHRISGEGHFAAKLLKKGQEAAGGPAAEKKAGSGTYIKTAGLQYPENPSKAQKDGIRDFELFCRECLKPEYVSEMQGELVWFAEQLYLLPCEKKLIAGLKTERAGLHLGSAMKNRFEPSHSWAMALKPENVVQYSHLPDPSAYLRGESTSCDPELKGWVLAETGGISAGWGKAQNGQLKNHYPKGLRKEV